MRLCTDGPLRGEVEAPGDKSCSHRAALLAALTDDEVTIFNFAPGEDCASTLDCLAALGVPVTRRGSEVTVQGRAGVLDEPDRVLDCGNSGTTMRLLAGLLSGQRMHVILSGDDSLNRRPMDRIVDPLRHMGADIRMREEAGAPLSICGGVTRGGEYRTPVASAQVKSAILLAGLYAESATTVREPGTSRDHTERMLEAWGVPVQRHNGRVRLGGKGLSRLRAPEDGVRIPGDISSVAFLVAAALLTPGSEVLIRNVGINPTRTGILAVLESMDARVEADNVRDWMGEPVADLLVRHSSLRPFQVEEDMVPTLIDEIPLLALLAAHARGTSTFRGVGELRFKETDRLAAVQEELGAVGVQCRVREDTLLIDGEEDFSAIPATPDARGDHRMAMTLALAGLPDGRVELRNDSAVDISYPQFFHHLRSLGARPSSRGEHLQMGLLGEGIEDSASPPMLRTALEVCGLRGSYRLFDVGSKDLGAAVRGLGALGVVRFNVTRPHKVAICRYLDRLAPSARDLEAVNTVVPDGGELVGHNTDVAGVARALRDAGFRMQDSRVLIVGAGGAARAALRAAVDGAAAGVHIANRSPRAAAELAGLWWAEDCATQVHCSGLTDVPGGRFDLIIQATPVGSLDASCPLPEHCHLGAGVTVLEMIYRPQVTSLVRRARTAGAKVVPGSEMLLHQGARAFELWTGEAAPVQKMREELGRVLRW